MKCATLLILLVLDGVMPSLANDLPPFAGPCAVMDRIAVVAGTAQTKAIAMDSLEKVALVRAAQISAEAEIALGLPAGMFQDKEFADPTVRVCALRGIGKTALGESVDFLSKLSPANLGPDPSQRVWPGAQVALRDAQLRRIADPYMQTLFLDGILSGMPDGRGAVAAWAVAELCDRGAQTSLPVIQKAITSAWSGQYGWDEVQFCEARIRVVMSNPDRAKALGSVLTAAGDTADTRLFGWAVNQLNSMQSASADAELDRFAREIERLPEGSPGKVRLGIYRQVIVDFQRQRAK